MDTYPSPGALEILAQSFSGQENAGPLAGLLLRLARFLGGDPTTPINVTSTGTANTQGLPDSPGAQSAVVQVGGAGISYRLDGGDPANGGGVIVLAGSNLELTGIPTIKGFRFVSASAAPSTVIGTFFD